VSVGCLAHLCGLHLHLPIGFDVCMLCLLSQKQSVLAGELTSSSSDASGSGGGRGWMAACAAACAAATSDCAPLQGSQPSSTPLAVSAAAGSGTARCTCGRAGAGPSACGASRVRHEGGGVGVGKYTVGCCVTAPLDIEAVAQGPGSSATEPGCFRAGRCML